MISLEQVVGGEAFTTEAHICPYCSREVPKIEVEIMGIRRMVQPVCRCEKEADDKEIAEFAQRKRKSEIEGKYSSLVNSPKYSRCTLDGYQVDEQNAKAFDFAKHFVNTWGASSKDLLIYGTPGNGKSHLAAAIGNALNDAETIVVFVSFTELIERIKSTFNHQSEENEAGIISAICKADLLILDDVGVEKASEFTLDVLYRIVERRGKNYRRTVYTSNYDPKQLIQRYSASVGDIEAQRVIGRILENAAIVGNFSRDRRLS